MQINRVLYVLSKGCLVLTQLLFASSCTTEKSADRPNVLLILVDDLRPALGCYGDPLAITPSIDALARRSTKFNYAYVQQAVCNPSRVSIMTGKRPDHTGILDNRTHFRTLHPETVTLPQYLSQQGYQTQAIGKIYHDPAWAQDSLSWTEPPLHVVTGIDGKYATEINKSLNKHHAYAWEIADDPGEQYIDIRVRNAAIDFLEHKRREPFFLAVGFRRPHLPFCAPRQFWEMHRREKFLPVPIENRPNDIPSMVFPQFEEHRNYEGVPDSGALDQSLIALMRHGYYAATSYIDREIGLVVETLEQTGLLDRTFIVLTSDHGYHLGERQWWCKTTNFELDARVPLLIYSPAQPKLQHCNALVELVDLYPSIVQFCGLEVPDGLDGSSVRHLLVDPQDTHKSYAISQFPRPWFYEDRPEYMGYSIRSIDFRYTEWVALRNGEVVGTELYNHRNDSLETINVAGSGQYSDQLRELQQQMSKIKSGSLQSQVSGPGEN